MEVNIYNLRGSDVGRSVTITGTVEKVEVPHIKIQNAAFQCRRCGAIIKEPQEGEKLTIPLRCDKEQGGCGTARKNADFRLLEKQSEFLDMQKIKIEQFVKEGSSPFISGLLTGELVGSVEKEKFYEFMGDIYLSQDEKKSSRSFKFILKVKSIKPTTYDHPGV